jgi:hypothetical protein
VKDDNSTTGTGELGATPDAVTVTVLPSTKLWALIPTRNIFSSRILPNPRPERPQVKLWQGINRILMNLSEISVLSS